MNCRGIGKKRVIYKVSVLDYSVSSYCGRDRDRDGKKRGRGRRKCVGRKKEEKKIKGEKRMWKKGGLNKLKSEQIGKKR
jgi:hypothetical protein